MKILIPVEYYQKLRAYVTSLRYEISGLGKILKNAAGNEFLIEDLRIFRQVVSPGNTILDKRALGRFYDDLVKEGEDMTKWRLWWHSHGNDNTFWSTTDIQTIEDFNTEQEMENYILSIVTNISGKMLSRIDVFEPARVTVENLDFEIVFDNKKIEDEAFAEVVEKVKTAEFIERRSKKRGKEISVPRSELIHTLPSGGQSTLFRGEEEYIFPPQEIREVKSE